MYFLHATSVVKCIALSHPDLLNLSYFLRIGKRNKSVWAKACWKQQGPSHGSQHSTLHRRFSATAEFPCRGQTLKRAEQVGHHLGKSTGKGGAETAGCWGLRRGWEEIFLRSSFRNPTCFPAAKLQWPLRDTLQTCFGGVQHRYVYLQLCWKSAAAVSLY